MALAMSLALVGACVSGSAPHSHHSDWGVGAEAWLRAEAAALATDIPYVAPLWSPEFRESFPPLIPAAIGRHAAIMAEMALGGRTVNPTEIDEVYLSDGGAVIVLAKADRVRGSVVLRSWDGRGARTAEALVDASTAVDEGILPPGGPVELQRLATRYVAAMTSRDAVALRHIYRGDALSVDSLLGQVNRGRERLVDVAVRQEPGSWELAPIFADSSTPAVAIRTRHLHRWGQGAVAFLMAWVHRPPGCVQRLAIEIHVRGGRIVRERTFHEVDSARACAPPGRLRDGWWARLTVPPLHPDFTTGTMHVLGHDFPVVNGSPATEDLVAWGLERFAAYGLPAPVLRGVAVYEGSAHCIDATESLRLSPGGDGWVRLCDIARECSTSGCLASGSDVQRKLLHEMAEVWLARLDDATRLAFLDHEGLVDWHSNGTAPAERGVERAADTMAWGLLGGGVCTPSVAHPTTSHLGAGFRMITGVDVHLDGGAKPVAEDTPGGPSCARSEVRPR